MASKQNVATERDIIEVLRSAPKSTVEEVAEALGVARSTAHRRLAAAITEGRVQAPSGRSSGAPQAARPIHGDRGPKAGREPVGERGAAPQKGAARLRPGELDGLVLGHIAAHPDEAPFGPTAVAKALGRSSGAIGNCLERLAGRGELMRVGERARRYGPKVG